MHSQDLIKRLFIAYLAGVVIQCYCLLQVLHSPSNPPSQLCYAMADWLTNVQTLDTRNLLTHLYLMPRGVDCTPVQAVLGGIKNCNLQYSHHQPPIKLAQWSKSFEEYKSSSPRATSGTWLYWVKAWDTCRSREAKDSDWVAWHHGVMKEVWSSCHRYRNKFFVSTGWTQLDGANRLLLWLPTVNQQISITSNILMSNFLHNYHFHTIVFLLCLLKPFKLKHFL